MRVYLASSLSLDKRKHMYEALEILRDKGLDVYAPVEHKIENAWDYPNDEWGLMVFQADIEAIKRADVVVMLSFGRESTAGANWEAGYSFGIGKTVIVVEIECDMMSIMVANGRYATVRGLDGLRAYDFNAFPKSRTSTEQK